MNMTENLEVIGGGVFEPKTTRDLRVVYDVLLQAIRHGIPVEEGNFEAWKEASKIDKGTSLSELEFIYDKLEILSYFQHWETLVDYCAQFLSDDVWCQELRVWESLLLAVTALKAQGTYDENTST